MSSTDYTADDMGRELISGHVYTSRDVVNVILPGTGPRGEGNHEYARPRSSSIAESIRGLIVETIRDERSIGRKVVRGTSFRPANGWGLGPWADRPLIIALRADQGSVRGVWTFTVYEDLRVA